MTYLVFDITFSVVYINQFIIELYSTIFETNVIKNVNTLRTSYMDIMLQELYITSMINGIGISAYTIINIVELIDTLQETGIIIYVETILLFYVFIFTSKVDNTIMEIERDIIAESHHHEYGGDIRAHPCGHPHQ